VKSYFYLKESVLDVIKALQYGPIVTALYIPESFKYYSNGIFDSKECEGKSKYSVNHSALIIGYNLEAETPYFELLNSWDDDWGEKGYFRIKIGKLSKKNKGHCLVAGTPFMIMPYIS
jgi:C1A family cysteine protease